MFNNLPGVQVQYLDGGLAAQRIPRSKSVLILGTAGQGIADSPYLVGDRNTAAGEFGFSGTLYKAMEEVAIYGDNIYLFRIGTSPATLAGVGAVSGGAAGFTLTLGDRTAVADTTYSLWYKNGVLYVWKNGSLVYANDTGAGTVVDTNDVIVNGAATAGLTIEAAAVSATPSLAKTPAGALTVAQAAALANSGSNLAPIFTAAVTGLNMNARQLYVAQQKAFELLDFFPVNLVCVPGATLDNPNVAFYVSTDATTAENNPATNANALGWLKTFVSTSAATTYHWANETANDAGTSISAQSFTNADDRIARQYYEVSFGHQLARFCAKQAEVLGGCIGFIGMRAPAKYDLASIRDWIGYKPTYDVNGNPSIAGKGLLGNPYLMGTTTAKLNSLTKENLVGSNVAYRQRGFFQTVNWEYDGGAMKDPNQNPIDIGAYLHVMGDWAYLQTSYGSYTGNLANLVAGYVSQLDEKSSTTFKPLIGITQLYRANLAQLDALTEANINMLRFRATGEPPVMLHGMTAATEKSDYTNLVRMRIKFMVVKNLHDEASKYLGEAANDGLLLESMRTSLDARLADLKKRGYLQYYDYQITTSAADQRIGRANINISFMPANELVQLFAKIGIQRQ